MRKLGAAKERYVHKYPKGYRLRFPSKNKYFSAHRYGSMDKALAAACVCRDNYAATGEFIVPPPQPTKRERAEELGVNYSTFRRRCKLTSVAEAYQHYLKEKVDDVLTED